ncbi:MAG: hypothetical protein LBT11_05550 [Treponema sp.]|jgi:hypothetical protein|nr:hypothetical protein [Treponema sp.]
MTIQQTVTIPADRRLHLDLPRDTPTGEAEMKLVITLHRGASVPLQGTAPQIEALPQSSFQQHFDEFYGCLKDSPAFAGDSAQIIRKMRDEW